MRKCPFTWASGHSHPHQCDLNFRHVGNHMCFCGATAGKG